MAKPSYDEPYDEKTDAAQKPAPEKEKETPAAIAAERDHLKSENEALRKQLDTGGLVVGSIETAVDLINRLRERIKNLEADAEKKSAELNALKEKDKPKEKTAPDKGEKDKA